ncbi:MAG: hypothetical protein WA888_19150 [Burkholderiaceae bacterium]
MNQSNPSRQVRPGQPGGRSISRWRLQLATIAIAGAVGGCAVVPLGPDGHAVGVSPGEAVVSTAIVTVGVLGFLGAISGHHRHWRGWGRGGHRGHGSFHRRGSRGGGHWGRPGRSRY